MSLGGKQAQRTSRKGPSSNVYARQNTLRPVARARIWILLGIFCVLAAILAAQLANLTLISGPANALEAANMRTSGSTIEAKRGTIYDRNGAVLATNIETATVTCNPLQIEDVSGAAAAIAHTLGGSPDEYIEPLTRQDTAYAFIARQADADAAEQLMGMGIQGLYCETDSKRVYPFGQTASQVVGLCNIDGKGQTGLESYYDELLAGHDGVLVQERGALNEPIAGGTVINQGVQDGADIVISIDIEMQEYLEGRIAALAEELEGKRAFGLVYNAGNGEILASASTPTFDPANRNDIPDNATTLMPVSFTFEPGSVFKAVTMAAILEEGVLSPDSQLYCPAALEADEYIITDAHERNDETMTLHEILARSSNIGTSLAAEQLGFDKLYQAMQRYNMTSPTGVDYPGDSGGYVTDQDQWSVSQSYNISFGQGVSVTPLQVARFYGAIANGGVECTPHYLVSAPGSNVQPPDATEQVFANRQALSPLVSMLEEVVEEGTGKLAQVDGFLTAGKTGTAEYSAEGESGYQQGSYNISFVGFLPDTSPQLVCFVGVTEVPGDLVATPAFKDIMTFAVNHFRITAS